MDEREARLPVDGAVEAECRVLLECLEESRAQRFRGVEVVVKMELDLSEPGARRVVQELHDGRLVLFRRVEPRVLRRPAVGVVMT